MRLCFVLLPRSTPLALLPLQGAFKEFPELGELGWLSSNVEGTSAFSVGGLNVLSALMPSPVPSGEADGATERSLSGLNGSWSLPPHLAHLVLIQQGAPAQTLEELTGFTRIVAAVVRATDAVGVYWPAASATHHPEFVVDLAHGELPLPVWVGVSCAKTRRGAELLSVGMGQLALPELLLRCPEVDGGALEFFYDLLAYVARRGKPLPEGHSVGRTEAERLQVRTERSPIDPDQKVWTVNMPAEDAAKATKKPAAKKPAAKKPARKKPARKKPARKKPAAK